MGGSAARCVWGGGRGGRGGGSTIVNMWGGIELRELDWRQDPRGRTVQYNEYITAKYTFGSDIQALRPSEKINAKG